MRAREASESPSSPPHVLLPPALNPYPQSISTAPRTPSSSSSRIGRSASTATPTNRIPSSRTHLPRNRSCTPNKLISSTPAQPTLAMTLVAPTPRTPQQRISSYTQLPHPSPPSRPPSRSECLLRNTLRKDDTRRTTATSRARSRSRSRSTCSDCDDDEFFQPALLFSPLPRSGATSRPHARNIQSRSFYVPNENEDSSYDQLLRSRSLSNSNSSGYPVSHVQQEKLDESLSTSLPRSYALGGSGAAPHEAVLRTRLERVLHRGMREEQRRIKRSPDEEHAQSSSASPPSLARSNSYSNSQASEKTHVTAPEVEPLPPSLSSKQSRGHRYSQSSVTQRSPRSPRSQRESSPWMTTPLPSSPSFSTPTKKSSSVPYATPSPRSPHPRILSTFSNANSQGPVIPPQFDLRAASQACKEVPGYVSFASVAGLGAPPGVGDDEVSVKEAQRGRGLARWWVF